ncbi:enoyl-CoA hydratase [Arthrobacter bambusae]|nr:enoyl-CoA hydratase [Arthrobacter bambusae]
MLSRPRAEPGVISPASSQTFGTSPPSSLGGKIISEQPTQLSNRQKGHGLAQQYENILVEIRGRVGLVTLNRPKALNALNQATMNEIVAAVSDMDADPGVGAVVITGSEKAFAAGADIKEMASKGYMDMYAADWFRAWENLTRLRIPVIAAVSGFALGGGCELAMMCDFIIAGDNAKFGQPEINLGVIPGMGGSQRLTRAVGKAKAMDMILTGRFMDAEEAERAGLVSRVVPADSVVEEAMKAAEVIASKSKPVAMVAKEAVNAAFETGLSQGVLFERRVFHSLFATEDQKEGMAAFTEKRQPEFKNR